MRLWIAAALVVMPLVAHAGPPQTGPLYSRDQLRAFDIAGLKLDVSNGDLERNLIADGYKETKPQVGLFGPDFVKDDKSIGSLEFDRGDGVWIVNSLSYTQDFKDTQFVYGLKEKIVQKFGEPTDYVDRGTSLFLSYHPKFDVDPRDESAMCPRTGDHCSKEDHDRFQHERFKAVLYVRITPNQVSLSLSDRQPGEDARASAAEAEAGARERARRAEEEAALARAKENTKSVKVGF